MFPPPPICLCPHYLFSHCSLGDKKAALRERSTLQLGLRTETHSYSFQHTKSFQLLHISAYRNTSYKFFSASTFSATHSFSYGLFSGQRTEASQRASQQSLGGESREKPAAFGFQQQLMSVSSLPGIAAATCFSSSSLALQLQRIFSACLYIIARTTTLFLALRF